MQNNSLVVVLSHVGLLLIFLALCLTVGAVPVDQHHQGQHEHQVGDQDGVRDRGQGLRPRMLDVIGCKMLSSVFKPVII